ncbi:MAG: hypothetical protein U0929_18495 [Planctomycetaceae bacterium]
MSSVHRILTGLEFVADLKFGRLQWPAETEDIVRLSLELARVTHSDLAFAAVARPPEGECDCGQLDCWMTEAEEGVERFVGTSSAGEFRIEQGAWFGDPAEEWPASAEESEMDLLIIPGTTETSGGELHWPAKAKCPVWFTGREPDRLEAIPPLIVCLDDLSEPAARYLSLAVELALAWNARLLIIHPLSPARGPLTKDEDDQLRQAIFGRLSRNDFRALTHGSQLRMLSGGLSDILNQISAEQVPNLVLASCGLAGESRPSWRGHLLLWPEE